MKCKSKCITRDILGSIIDNTTETVKGNITVEAAMVMPIVILTVFSLIYLSFLLYDRNHIQGVVDRVLHDTTLILKYNPGEGAGLDYEGIEKRGIFNLLTRNKVEEKKNLENYLREELKKGLMQYEISEITAEVGIYQISIEVKVLTQIKLPILHKLFQEFSYRRTYASSPVHNPVDTIRIAEVILDTGENIKGVEELKNALEELGVKKD